MRFLNGRHAGHFVEWAVMLTLLAIVTLLLLYGLCGG